MIFGIISSLYAVAKLSVLLFVVGATTSVAQAQSASGLSEIQQAKVLEEAVQILGGNANVIVRWNAKVTFAVVGGDTAAQETAREVISEVSKLTAIPVELLEHRISDVSRYLDAVTATPEFQLDVCAVESESTCSNFVLVFTDNQTMLALAEALPMRSLYASSLHEAIARSEPIPCFFSPFQVRNAEILQALVYVNESLSNDMLSTCVYEEIYQSFGLFADVTDSAFYSFDNRVIPKKITDYDKALLSAVYDASLSPGAPVFAVLKVLVKNLGFDLYNTADD